MIKQLQIHNLQSHKRTILKFHPGVNAFVGNSDVGKSAILRALRLLIWNTPGGTEYISNWAKKCIVKGIFDNCTIKRTRSKTINEYQINNDTPLSGFGQSVPDPVKTLLNFDTINFQHQMDVPFMIGWKPGERGEFLSRQCGLNKTIESIDAVNSMLRAENAQKKQLENDIEEIDKELKDLPDIEAAEKLIEQAEALSKKISSRKKKMHNLTTLINDIGKLEEKINSYADRSHLEDDIKAAIEESKKMENEKKRAHNLNTHIKKIERNEYLQEILQNRIKRQEKKLKKSMPDICPLCGATNEKT